MPWYCINCDRYELDRMYKCNKCGNQKNSEPSYNQIQNQIQNQNQNQNQIYNLNPNSIYNDYYPTSLSSQYQNDLMMFDENALIYTDHSFNSDPNLDEVDEDSNLEIDDYTYQQLSNAGIVLEDLHKFSYLFNRINSNLPKKNDEDDKTDTTVLGKCIICDVNPRYMAYIHNDNTSHLLSCYDCAKKLKHNNNGCPICRQSIKSIVKVYL